MKKSLALLSLVLCAGSMFAAKDTSDSILTSKDFHKMITRAPQPQNYQQFMTDVVACLEMLRTQMNDCCDQINLIIDDIEGTIGSPTTPDTLLWAEDPLEGNCKVKPYLDDISSQLKALQDLIDSCSLKGICTVMDIEGVFVLLTKHVVLNGDSPNTCVIL